GGENGCVELYAYGMYKIATLPEVSGTCRNLSLSGDLKSLSVITEVRSADNSSQICYTQLDTGLLSDCLPEVTRMARKFTHISTLLQYLHLSLTCMCEAWEDILMQMDLRLTKFVQEKNTNTQVQDEFLELLLWGQSSPELQALLMNQLTIKGLKKLGQSIESSYSTIQKLVISHLQSHSGSEALLYHLSEVKGMSLWKQKFEPLGLDAAAIEDAITAVGSFSLKANELLQVIDKSMKNFKAFFRWLYVAMLRMCDEPVPPELNKMTQKDIAFVADFLSEHFNENEELFDRKGKYFNVERVGQYLSRQKSQREPEALQGRDGSSSLKALPLLALKSARVLSSFIEHTQNVCIHLTLDYHFWRSHLTHPVSQDPQSAHCFVITEQPATYLTLLTFPSWSNHVYRCLDARFYDDETLTVVLQGSESENRKHFLAQIPLASTLSCETQFSWEPNVMLEQQSGAIPCQDLVLGNQWRELENMKAQFVAVNGIRKVACVLSANLRHIRVFEMDVEDEDDEGAESQNAS
uniref:Anaphase-promoting complex subunit 4 n=1 Tax=Tetraodon nigroviridis TaxID=99883 RepID=H3DJX4_TETNG